MKNKVERVLFVGFCGQICIGMLWMVLRFCGSLAASESLFSMGKNEFVAHVWCLLQLLIAGFASYHLLKTLGISGKKWRICGVLAMLTFPMAMQCHLTLGTDSIVSSLLLLLFSAGIRCIHGGKERTRGQVGVIVLTVVLLAGISVYEVGVNKASNTEYTKLEEKWETSMVSRFAWSSLQTLYGTWPEEIKEVLPEQIVRETSYYADNVERVLLPCLQQTYGTDEQGSAQTSAVLQTITRIALESNTKGICREILWDMAGYGLSPIVVQLQLAGMGYDSYTGILYDHMGQRTPYLSHLYMTYGCRWFGVALLLGMLLGCTREKRSAKGTLLFGLLFVGGIIGFYAMRGGGMMDYRKTVVLVLLQLAWVISRAERSRDVCISNTDIGN